MLRSARDGNALNEFFLSKVARSFQHPKIEEFTFFVSERFLGT